MSSPGQERSAGLLHPLSQSRVVPARYVPDLIAVTDKGMNVIVEIKGQVTDSADAKAKATERWTAAVIVSVNMASRNNLMVTDPRRMAEETNPFTAAQCSKGPFRLNP